VWGQKKTAKASKAKKSSKRAAPLCLPNALSGELSEYEKAREDNIKVSNTPPAPPVTSDAYPDIIKKKWPTKKRKRRNLVLLRARQRWVEYLRHPLGPLALRGSLKNKKRQNLIEKLGFYSTDNFLILGYQYF
jgi:hypothetical protein